MKTYKLSYHYQQRSGERMKFLKIVTGFILFALAIQLIPYGKDHTNPKAVNKVKWDSAKTEALFTKACADCHSFHTKWPWYSHYAPASWLIMWDVQEGREHLNVSVKVTHKQLQKAIKEIQEGDMPPLQYTLIHKDAKLTKQQRADLINGLKRTFAK